MNELSRNTLLSCKTLTYENKNTFGCFISKWCDKFHLQESFTRASRDLGQINIKTTINIILGESVSQNSEKKRREIK